MMEMLRNWLLGITASAMILALADSLTPEGTVKRVGKLAGGLFLIVAVLQPVLSLDYSVMAAELTKYQIEVQGYSNALEVENERLKKIIIEDRTGAYIQDKAAGLDLQCEAEVSCRLSEEGVFYPASVVIYGNMTQAETEALARLIEGELAIPVQNQRYERTNEP